MRIFDHVQRSITRFSTIGLLSAWSAVIGFLGVIAFLVVSQLGCDSIQFYGKRSQMSEVITYSNLSCNAHCGCSSSQYEPICSADGETVFFSPCQAGCTAVDELTTINKDGKINKRYRGCECVAQSLEESKDKLIHPISKKWQPNYDLLLPATLENGKNPTYDYAYDGYCPADCSNQYSILIGMILVIGLIGSTSRLPNMLIFLRAIDQQDKAAGVTVTVSFISAFGLLPSPIIYGHIYDNACIIWAEKCGEELNCLAYNTDVLRASVGTLSAILMALGLCCDIGVWYYSKSLRLYDENKSSVDRDSRVTTIRSKDQPKEIILELDQKLHYGSIEEYI